MSATLQFNLTDSDPSIGGDTSSNQLPSDEMNNLFDNVSADEASAGMTDYRAVDVTNTGDADASSPVVFLKNGLLGADDSAYSDATLQFGIESSPVGSTTSVADESTAPGSVSFSAYDSDTPLSLPDIPTSSYARVWIKRTVSAGANNDADVHGTIVADYA